MLNLDRFIMLSCVLTFICVSMCQCSLRVDFEPCAYMNSIFSLEGQPKSNEILILLCRIAANTKTNKIISFTVRKVLTRKLFLEDGLLVVSCHCEKIGKHYVLF